jgi:C_GCAxxG_C_C family probable redox protein
MLAVGEHVLDEVPEDYLRMANAFAGGVGLSLRDQCGAYSAGVMIIGALFGRAEPDEDDQLCQQVIADFRTKFVQEIGSVNCGELREETYGSDNEIPCSALVKHAVDLLLSTIQSYEENGAGKS